MLLPLLIAGLQSAPAELQAPAHARLHPADATFFLTVPDVAGLPAAYSKGALWSIVTDPDLAEAVSNLTGGEVELGLVLDRIQMMMEPANLPPEMVAMGLDAAIKDLRAVSSSVVLPEDVPGTLEPFLWRVKSYEALITAKYRGGAEFYGSEQSPPATIDGLATLLGDDASVLDDPYGNRFGYRVDPESAEGFLLTAFGADGQPGGEGVNADISSDDRMETEAMEFVSKHLAIRVALEFGSAETAAQLFGTISGMGVSEEVGKMLELGDGARGFGIIPPGEEQPVATLTQTGTHLFLSVFGDGAEAAVAAAGTRAGGLLVSPDYRSALSGLKRRGGTALYEAYARRSFAAVFADVLEVLAQADGIQLGDMGLDGKEVALQLAQFMRGAASEHPVVAERVVLEDGLFLKDKFHPVDPVTARARMAEPKLDAGMLASIPADAALVIAMRKDVNEMGAALRGLLETFGGMGAQAGFDAAGMLAALEEQAGGRIEDRVFAYLGDQVLITSEPIRGPSIPNTLLQIPVTNEAALIEGLAAWYGALGNSFPEDLRYKDRAYKGFPLYSLTLSNVGFISPGLATSVKDGVMITGLQNSHVRDLLRGPRGGDDAARPLHPLQAGELAIGKDVHSVTFVDLAAYFDGLYGTAKSFGSIAAGFVGGELPFDLTQLPDAELVTRHLRPSISTARWTEQGLAGHGQGSFGPEFIVAAALAPLVVLGASQQATVPPPEFGYVEELVMVQSVDDAVAAKNALKSVRVGLQAYRYANGGAYPASLSLLAEPAEGYPKGFLAEGVSLMDIWGHELGYSVDAGADTYELYSHGRNGVDEGGAGDDIRP